MNQLNNLSAQKLIEILNLSPLQGEGGFYRQTFKSDRIVGINESESLNYKRSAGTAIYYLITPESFSNWHRLKHEEIFHFYYGESVEMTQILQNGEKKTFRLGSKLLEGEAFQVVVPANTWQSTRLISPKGWALLGCTVCPGFEYEDFELKKDLDPK
jgi:predicted cupin superfamily sugar epimerase